MSVSRLLFFILFMLLFYDRLKALAVINIERKNVLWSAVYSSSIDLSRRTVCLRVDICLPLRLIGLPAHCLVGCCIHTLTSYFHSDV